MRKEATKELVTTIELDAEILPVDKRNLYTSNAPIGKCLHQLIEDRADLYPESLAIAYGDIRLRYIDLEVKANQLANYLKSNGVKSETVVGIDLPRSDTLIVALLAVLKAGGSYLPLNSTDPLQRRLAMLSDSKAQFVIVFDGSDYTAESINCVNLKKEESQISRSPSGRPVSFTVPENAAYVIFTSGSTGRPKGVVIPHRGVVNTLLWLQNYIGVNSTDGIQMKMPLGFDFSVQEIFLPLVCGARLLLKQVDAMVDNQFLSQVDIEPTATVVSFVPAVLQAWMQTLTHAPTLSARAVICCGEALPRSIVTALHAAWDGPIYNFYGPTEASIFCTAFICQPNNCEFEPIGTSIANTKVYLLDENMDLVTGSDIGEIYISGFGLARGYVNQPGLTSECFVADPYSNGFRMYRTGDLGRYMSDGNLECVGRRDRQVKLRGHRIELSDIEAAITALSVIRQVAIVMAPRGEHMELIAYLTVYKETTIHPEDIRSLLKSKLPSYMIPSEFIWLDEIPLNVNGKVDYPRLQHAFPEASMHPRPSLRQRYVAAGDPIELRLVNIWEEVLEITPIGIHDDFLDLGGHSTVAIRILNLIRETFVIELSVRDLFAAMNIAGLARIVNNRCRKNTIDL